MPHSSPHQQGGAEVTKREKFKWKCKKCKKSNFAKKNVVQRHIKDFDELTTDTAIIELPCGRCHTKNLVEVSGLLGSGLWLLRTIKGKAPTYPRAVVSKDTDMALDKVRMLMAQGRVAPWSDIFDKETVLIYQVYVEDGDIKTRLRSHMVKEELVSESFNVLERDISEPYLEMIHQDLEKYDWKNVSGGGSE